MKRSQLIMIASAVTAIAAIVIVQSQTVSTGNGSRAGNSAAVNQTATAVSTPALKTVAAPAKTPDVFFLSESGSEARRNSKSPVRPPRVNGSHRISQSQPITSKEEGEFMAPQWSPDGLELLFSKPGYSGLYTKGTNGGDIAQVTGKEHIAFGAKWKDDGSIESRTNSGEKQAFNPDGSPVDSVAMEEDTSRTGPFTKDDTVYLRANPGEAAVPISAGDDRFYGGVVSPDGKYIVYNGLHTGLYIQPLDGSTSPISIGPGSDPSWLPDGSGIVYSLAEDDGHNLVDGDLYMASRDGGTISNLTQTPGVIELKPAVSSDGSRIAFEADGRIYVGSFQ